MIVQRVISLFSSYIVNKTPYLVSVPQDCKNYVRNISRDDWQTNVSEEKSTTRQGLICGLSFPLHVFDLVPRPWERDWHEFPPSPPEYLA